MSSHEFDAYLDMQPLEHFDPPYHEQLTVMHEFECTREDTLRQEGAIDALRSLTITLSALCLREDVHGDYFFGLHAALEVIRNNLDVARGGVA